MLSGVIEGMVALVIAGGGMAVLIGQLKENARTNKAAIEEIKLMVIKGQEDTKEIIKENMQEMKDTLDDQKEDQASALAHEISHVKDTLSITINEIRDDIRRLETNQNETIRLREDLSLLKASVRSLHKRLDIEIPDSIRNHDRDED
jgi:predicted  nucleic acid-binding Zn-ribbon protein